MDGNTWSVCIRVREEECWHPDFSLGPSWSCRPHNQSMKKKGVLMDYILLPSNVDLYIIFDWSANYSQWEVLYLWIIIPWNKINKSIDYVYILFDLITTLQYLYMLNFIFSPNSVFYCNFTHELLLLAAFLFFT